MPDEDDFVLMQLILQQFRKLNTASDHSVRCNSGRRASSVSSERSARTALVPLHNGEIFEASCETPRIPRERWHRRVRHAETGAPDCYGPRLESSSIARFHQPRRRWLHRFRSECQLSRSARCGCAATSNSLTPRIGGFGLLCRWFPGRSRAFRRKGTRSRRWRCRIPLRTSSRVAVALVLNKIMVPSRSGLGHTHSRRPK